MISPRPADVGRAVILPRFNADPLEGVLIEVPMKDMIDSEPLVWVRYPDMRMPILTEIERLEWAE